MKNNIILTQPIVSATWLKTNLNALNLVILDASFPQPEEQIPNTRYFDIKKKFSDAFAPFPNTLPSEEQFIEEARKLGINNSSAIVVYDDKGIYWSARVWYMFNAFGHNNVAVLSGGLPAWIRSGFETEPQTNYEVESGNFSGTYNPKFFKFFDDVKKESQDKSHTIVDARSEKRFKSLEPEPREGLRRGTIPNSINLPYTTLLDNGCLKDEKELKNIFETLVKEDSQLTFSCGSGITACVLALGATIADHKNISVYDGSWTEWGSLTKE
ncbi:sulfurtransferase [Yeosuana sp. MJ-SS3]|uniref:Sulfurtransferase n=1 Tax=Gilvirhabdus luticola TaxID=3079858 RepID=A0ABU3UAB5_9FLAO|nr:sulfurtransferase [Yeosuana sp. MJ-SS3]MDU8887025.1 sulfurtransferase [Yeosuana sp. MJ-SS3]